METVAWRNKTSKNKFCSRHFLKKYMDGNIREGYKGGGVSLTLVCLFVCFVIGFFKTGVSLCSPGSHGTRSVDQAGL